MIELRRCWAGRRGKCLSLLLTLSLALNLLGPLTGLPEKDGYVPICTGSEIIYVPFGDIGLDRQTDDSPAPVSESCPWFAQFHAVEVASIAAGASDVVYGVDRLRPTETVASGQQSPGSFQARAPPRRDA